MSQSERASPARAWFTRWWKDLLLALLLGILGGVGSFQASRQVPSVVTQRAAQNAWFDADSHRIYRNLTKKGVPQKGTRKHPLFPLATVRQVKFFGQLGLPQIEAVRAFQAVTTAGWLIALFLLLRAMGCRKLDASLFSALGGVSAALLFWSTVPETYLQSSVSILVGLLLAAAVTRRSAEATEQYSGRRELILLSLASAVTLSMTVTNWMVGLAAALTHATWKRALLVSVTGLALVTGLWAVQRTAFPETKFFLERDPSDRQFFLRSETGGPLAIGKVLLLDTMVLSRPELTTHPLRAEHRILNVQQSPLGSGGPLGAAGTALWVALLGLGGYVLVSRKEHGRMRLLVGMALFGQVTLHLLFGVVTFLYALNVLPLLLLVAAQGSVTHRTRPFALGLAAALLVCAAVNNVQQFGAATQMMAETRWANTIQE